MNIDRIEEIQKGMGYPYDENITVQQALLKVWNETAQNHSIEDAKVWAMFAAAYATSINNGADTRWVINNTDSLLVQYKKRFG